MLHLKRLLPTLAAFGAGVVAGGLLVSCAIADQPHMEAAIDYLQRALREMQVAEPNKGGHKARAIEFTKAAIEEAYAGMEYAEY